MTDRERSDAMYLLRMLKKKVSMQDGSVSGFNVGANSGSSAGQSVMHAHIHLIPRRDGDTPHPKGGIRGAVPARMSY